MSPCLLACDFHGRLIREVDDLRTRPWLPVSESRLLRARNASGRPTTVRRLDFGFGEFFRYLRRAGPSRSRVANESFAITFRLVVRPDSSRRFPAGGAPKYVFLFFFSEAIASISLNGLGDQTASYIAQYRQDVRSCIFNRCITYLRRVFIDGFLAARRAI